MIKTKHEEMNDTQQRLTRRSSFSSGVLMIGGSTAVYIIFLFVEMMVAVRYLDTESYGIYILMVTITNFLVMFIDFGFQTATTQKIASSPYLRQIDITNNVLICRSLIIAVISVAFVLGRNLLMIVDSSGGILHYVLYIPIMMAAMSFDELFTSTLQGFHAYKHIAVAHLVRSLLRLCLTVVFLKMFQWGMLALVYSWIISFGISIIYQCILLPVPKRFMFNRQLLEEIFKFGFPLQMSRFLWFVSTRVNVLLLGMLATPISVAYFAVADRIPNAFYFLSASFITVFFPNITTLLAEGERKKAKWMLDQSLRLVSFLMALFALIAVLFDRQIVILLFTEKYFASSRIFAVLMIALHMGFIVQLMGYTLTAAGYPKRSLIENAVRTSLIVVGNLVLIPVLGIIGVAVATLNANYIGNPLSVWLLKRSDIRVAVSSYSKQTGILLLCVVLYWSFHPTIFLLKAAIIPLFIAANLLLSTVSFEDFKLIIPEGLLRRLSMLSKR